MEPVRLVSGPVSVLDRADVDTDQIIPKQFLKRVERTGFGEFLFYDWAKEPGWDLPANPILAAGPELRLRLEPRARAVGAAGLRLPRRRGGELRRHLLLQLHQDRPAAGRAAGGGGARADGGGGGGGRPRGPGGPLRGPGRPLRARPRSAAAGCSRASTTSPSRSRPRTRSRPTRPSASGKGRSRRRCSESGSTLWAASPGARGAGRSAATRGERRVRTAHAGRSRLSPRRRARPLSSPPRRARARTSRAARTGAAPGASCAWRSS